MTQEIEHTVEGSLFRLYVGYKWVFANVSMTYSQKTNIGKINYFVLEYEALNGT
jgi:hypothetical protein